MFQVRGSFTLGNLHHAKSATGEECKMKTLQRVKVQHEIVQYIKRVQQEKDYYTKKCNMEMVQYKKGQHEKITDVNSKRCTLVYSKIILHIVLWCVIYKISDVN